jgi:hypothetical protein
MDWGNRRNQKLILNKASFKKEVFRKYGLKLIKISF